MAPPVVVGSSSRKMTMDAEEQQEGETDEELDEEEEDDEEERALMIAEEDGGAGEELDEMDEEAAAEEAVLLMAMKQGSAGNSSSSGGATAAPGKSGSRLTQHHLNGGRQSAPLTGTSGQTDLKCSACEFTTRSRVTLQRHERVTHLKKKFFRCVKCNYVTHVKARYTKHVKYHSMPMIKCDLCEFRTPYKWNLDRHLKNHMGGGMYQCSLCNFTAHIKQSLTVHIQNHHLSPDKARSARRRNKVGASDQQEVSASTSSSSGITGSASATVIPGGVALFSDADEEELLRMERMEHHGDDEDDLFHHQSGLEEDNEEEVSERAATVDRHHNFLLDDSEDADEMKLGLEMNFHHLLEQRNNHNNKRNPATTQQQQQQQQVIKKARPVPNLIPLAAAVGSSSSSNPTILKIPQFQGNNKRNNWDNEEDNKSPPILDAVGLLPRSNNAKSITNNNNQPVEADRKRKSCFLDQLAQKLAKTSDPSPPPPSSSSSALMDIIHPSPLVVIPGPSSTGMNNISWSSRCQHCRQRCKTRADLLAHLKQCPKALEAAEASQQSLQQQHHPMENKVFVWNNSNQQVEEESTGSSGSPAGTVSAEVSGLMEGALDDVEALMMAMMAESAEEMTAEMNQHLLMARRPSSVAGSDISEASLVGVETAPGIGAVTGGAGSAGGSNNSSGGMAGNSSSIVNSGGGAEGRSTVRRVYRCPQCSFWATTASRFHVHMVGHTNTKPFECSQCSYRSNWRWDITKHIKLKAARDPAHTQARVLLLDSSGERHYDQYDRYLVMMRVTESSGGPSLTHGRFALEEMNHRFLGTSNQNKNSSTTGSTSGRKPHLTGLEHPASLSPSPSPSPAPSPIPNHSEPCNLSISASSNIRPPPALNALVVDHHKTLSSQQQPRRTIWKCKRCIFKHKDKRMVLAHMAKHTRRDNFSCGLCGKGSNWQSVIRRHCRLKHNGNIQVIENRMMDEDGPELSREGGDEPIPSGSGHLHAALSMIDNKLGTSKKSYQGKSSPSTLPSGDEDSMGYMMHPDKQQYSCSTCPFICKSITDIEVHRQHHKAGPGRPVKCTLCPFFVADKQELTQHLLIHGLHDMKLDASGNLCSFGEPKLTSLDDGIDNSGNVSAGSSNTKRLHHCGLCPYVCESKNQYVYHRQFHRARGAPYKCPHCSFNVTRRHLLNQHLPVHQESGNISIPNIDDFDHFGATGSEEEAEAAIVDGAGAEDSAASSVETEGSLQGSAADAYGHLNLDPAKMAKLDDSVTMDLADIPLTWVSRGRKFYKMFKCRHCPHVNVRKANIQEHEKRHNLGAPGSSGGTGDNLHACALCNYRCNNAGVLSAHVKVHQSVLGIIHGLAGQDPTKTDDEQLRALVLHLSEPDHQIADESCSSLSSSESSKNQPKLDVLLGRVSDDPELMLASEPNNEQHIGGLHFCAHCPARFLVEAELLIHQRFHGTVKLAFRCNFCSYTARQEAHLLAHWKVHSSEYQERTRILTEQHGISSQHPRPFIKAVHQSEEDEVEAIDLTRKEQPSNTDGLSLCCPLCPAKFGRESSALLQYHSTLHGSNGPFKCRHCNYAVKAQDNLTKHEKLHLQKHSAESSSESKHQLTNNTSKRYQCPKCPSSFEKKEQFKVHSNLHGSKQRYRCDRCDYAVKYYANYLQHVKKHEEQDSLSSNSQSITTHPEAGQSTAERQHLWLQEKLQRSPPNGELLLSCQFCPFKTNSQPSLATHTAAHACQGATGSVRCNFCDFTAAEQSHLADHIQLHFQLKGRTASKLPESYWKCSNLEIWSEPVNNDDDSPSQQSAAALVFTENNSKVKTELEDEEDEEDALYIDLNTSQPLKDDPNQVEI